ncbi:relaxase/mobilization nuclease domain-containing protein [Ruminococcus sp.]|uniref:relaxase/mobilization nuclease domain-containing protein n=1 Tax=Ruminococcus sp. TaxID=41978 RepID=UPI002E79D767|nr:relaxase/mobilization nuclease domain-containing protein [Ruminococcus sp.]MEE1261727.1 relaxase/mobilization nuclease domain-containing protein [Ruminococcus sp.]
METVIFIKEGRQNRSAMRAVINYCQQEHKTYDSKSKRRLVSGVNCDGANSFREFMATKKVYGKDNGMFFYHYAQSFSPTEKITPEQAHKIALEFAEKAWEGHEVLVATHCDASHIHSHFVINSVGFESGMKLRQSPSTLKHLRKLSDEICLAYGLSVLKPYESGGKRMSTREYRARMKGESWKQKLANDIDKAMEFSGSKDEFICSMSILGYHMTWTDERKYLTFHCPNGRSCRDIKLHDDKYLKDNIERELLQREFPDGEKQPTGWEDSRELYEQHLRERALAKAELRRVAESYS